MMIWNHIEKIVFDFMKTNIVLSYSKYLFPVLITFSSLANKCTTLVQLNNAISRKYLSNEDKILHLL